MDSVTVILSPIVVMQLVVRLSEHTYYPMLVIITRGSALLVYEWLLCLGQEVRFVWGRRSVATVASVVYILSRYAMLIQYVVAIATNFPMSDLVRSPFFVLPSSLVSETHRHV